MREPISFPELDAAFAELAGASPVYPPGSDAVRRTVGRRRRRRQRIVRGLASVVAVLVLGGAGWSAAHRHDRPAVIQIQPAGPGRWWPSPLPTDPSQLGEIAVQSYSYGSDPIPMALPSSDGGCPAVTLRFDTDRRATVHGVKYELLNLTAAYGDLTGDGHSELAVVVSCQFDGRRHDEIVVLTSLPGFQIRTLALGPVAIKPAVAGMAIGDGVIITYSHPTIQNAATEIHRYHLDGHGGLTVQGPSASPS